MKTYLVRISRYVGLSTWLFIVYSMLHSFNTVFVTVQQFEWGVRSGGARIFFSLCPWRDFRKIRSLHIMCFNMRRREDLWVCAESECVCTFAIT